MLTGSAEAVLVAIVRLPDEQRKTLKLRTIASLSACSERSVNRAIVQLKQHNMLMMDRPCDHGPDAVYSFEITNRGMFYGNALRGTDI